MPRGGTWNVEPERQQTSLVLKDLSVYRFSNFGPGDITLLFQVPNDDSWNRSYPIPVGCSVDIQCSGASVELVQGAVAAAGLYERLV